MVLEGIKYNPKMSQIITEEYPNSTVVGFMKLDQTANFYYENTPFSFLDASIHDAKNSKKKLESLANRYCLFNLIKNSYPDLLPLNVLKTRANKPYLEGSLLHISLSHSNQWSAAAISDYPLGIDIQIKTEKIKVVASKFCNEAELDWLSRHDIDGDYLHWLWSAKESLIKAYGLGSVDFRKDLGVLFMEEGKGLGIVDKEKKSYYDLHFQKINNYYFAISTLTL